MLPDEVREAVDALYQRAHESGVFFYMPTNAEARDTIRAHLLAREAEVERLREERDSQQRSAIASLARAERAEALLREAVALLHPDTDEHKRITAHLSENSRELDH